MARLDRFLDAMDEYKAEALLLEQDTTPTFRFLSGTKPVSKKVLSADDILHLIGDLAGTDAIESFKSDGRLDFDCESSGRNINGTIETEAGRLVATLWKAAEETAQAVASPTATVDETSFADVPVNRSAPEPVQAAPAPVSPVAKTQSSGGLPSLHDGDRGAELIPDDLPASFRQRMDQLLRSMIDKGASDLHLCCGDPPVYRVDGEVVRDESGPRLQGDEMLRTLFSITPQRNRDQFMDVNDTDYAYAIEGVSRYRCNLFMDRHGPGAVFRAIPDTILSADQLGLPPAVRELAYLNKGLVLVTGPTGSGKSTTLAAIVDLVNQVRSDHIITIEDPIEFVHPNKSCLVNQRQVGVHTKSFKAALRAALREDPDVVLVGELRDLETIAIAIETAETGHLVFGTLHTTTAASTIDRIIDQFPADRQSQVRVMLSESMRAIVSQTLCKKEGGGRVAAQEILLGMPSISNLIREGKTFQIESQMQMGKKHGMQSLNDHLMRLIEEKLVAPKEAYMKSVDKEGLKQALQRAGHKLEL